MNIQKEIEKTLKGLAEIKERMIKKGLIDAFGNDYMNIVKKMNGTTTRQGNCETYKLDGVAHFKITRSNKKNKIGYEYEKLKGE